MSDSKIKVSVIIHQIINALKVQNQSEKINKKKKKNFNVFLKSGLKRQKLQNLRRYGALQYSDIPYFLSKEKT